MNSRRLWYTNRHRRGGIIIDDHLQTNDQSVFAIGECALYKDMIYGLVAPGYEMAEILVANICNKYGPKPDNPLKSFRVLT